MEFPSLARAVSMQQGNASRLITTAALVVSILSMSPRASAETEEHSITPEMLAEIFPKVSLNDISRLTKAELHDLIINNDSISIQDIRKYLLAGLKSISQRIKEDTHNKIMTDADFRSLNDIKEYILIELERERIFPTSLSVQIVPFYKDSEGNHNYLEISIVTKHETIDIPLSTPNSETPAVASILGEIINDFEKHIYEATLDTFNEEFENTDIFRRGTMERKIDDILKPKFESCIKNCIEYKGVEIIRGDDGKADIYVRYLDIASGVICYILVETDIFIPSKVPNDGPMMMAQNTVGIQE